MDTYTLHSELAQVLGTEVVSSDSTQLQAMAVDGLVPGAILRPANAEEAAACLKYADERGLKVAVRGSGTHTGLGNSIERLDLVLSTERLNSIFEYSQPDLMVGVQAGMRLADLQAELEKHEQFLPVETTATGAGATVGGAIATNGSGPLRLAYGPARDWLIGVKFVLADGTPAKGGGRVVKNVAGFDMMKLFIGLLGTLGLIHEMNFKLMPIPSAITTLVAPFQTLKGACQVALDIIEAGLFPSALSVLDRAGGAALGLPDQEATLLIEVRNTALAVERQVREIADLCQANGETRPDDLTDRDVQRKLWRAVTDFGYREEAGPRNFTLKVSSLPDQSVEVLAEARRLADRHEISLQSLSHAGHGLTWLTGNFEQDAAAITLIRQLTTWVERRGGAVAAERVSGPIKAALGDVWGKALSEGELRLMSEVRLKLDPRQTLNPGRFVGKI